MVVCVVSMALQFDPGHSSSTSVKFDRGYVEKCSICYPTDGRGVFERRPKEYESVVEYQYWPLDYENLTVGNWWNNTYGKHIMLVTKEAFQNGRIVLGIVLQARSKCSIWYE